MEAELPPGAQVRAWLQAAKTYVRDYLQEEGGAGAPDLCDDIIRCIMTLCHQLPLSYSFASVSQLLCLQKALCVSALGWDTERFQEWSQQGLKWTKSNQSQPPVTLSRARLLLVGYISSRDGPVHDGNLYVRDSSGCIPCEMSMFDLNLLGSLVLFPCWSYIPTGHGKGYIEVLSPPISITTSGQRAEVPDRASATALSPEGASQLLCSGSHPPGRRVSVTGQLASFTSLISIRDKPFFFFILQGITKSVPVIVKVPEKLCWYHALDISETYEVTSLSVSSLRGSSQQIFAVTSSSFLIPRPPLSPSCSTSLSGSISEELTTASSGGEEPHGNPQQRGNEKVSKTLTYKGVVTCVKDVSAGLYELDGSIVLCTAYTQLQNGGRGLREGARVEVFDAHLQQSPSPLFPTIVLSTCLGSRIRVLEFSRLSTPCSVYSAAGNPYLHLLFHYRLRLPEYIWVWNVMRNLQDKLRPQFVRQRCLARHTGSSSQSIAEKLLSPLLSSFSDGRCERDLYEEMVARPHNCPLQKYSPLPPPWSLPELSDVSSLACKPEYLRTTESNRSLVWCQYSLPSEDLSPPHVILGVLHASSSGFLQLKDQTSSLTCLILPRPPIAWIGSIIEVRRYQLVVETLQCKDLGTEQRSRTYIMFLAEDVTVLHLPQNCPSCSVPKPAGPSPSKVRRMETTGERRLLLIESMEGMLTKPDQGKLLKFQAKASWLDIQGPACGEKDGGNSTELSKDGDKPKSKVLLLFSSSSVRWFPLLRPNRRYKVIASRQTDAGILDSSSECCADIPHGLLCLKVPGDWTLEDVESGEHSYNTESFSIENVLKTSPSGSLVSVSGTVSSRSMCEMQSAPQHRSRRPDNFLPPGVSIRVILIQPASQSSVSVYLDLTLGPYPLGMLPGASVLMQGLERKVSRSGKPYLRSVPTTYICVLSPPTEISDNQPSPPLVLFRHLSGLPSPQRALCSVTCILSVTLFWDCSMCHSTFTQGSCERSPFCTSQSGVFRAKAWVKAEDGSGEVQLYLQDDAICLLLAIPTNLWEALQRKVLVRGKVTAKNRGRSELLGEEQNEDVLVDDLTFLMSRPDVSRQLVVTFRQTGVSGGQTSATAQLTRFTRGDREYMTRVPSPPTLTCLQLEEVEPRGLCRMVRERQPRGS